LVTIQQSTLCNILKDWNLILYYCGNLIKQHAEIRTDTSKACLWTPFCFVI